MAGDDDEEDVDDIEHEFKIDDDKKPLEKNNHITEAMLHGKMTYGRGPDDEENSQYPPVITGGRSGPVCKVGPFSLFDFQFIYMPRSRMFESKNGVPCSEMPLHDRMERLY